MFCNVFAMFDYALLCVTTFCYVLQCFFSYFCNILQCFAMFFMFKYVLICFDVFCNALLCFAMFCKIIRS